VSGLRPGVGEYTRKCDIARGGFPKSINEDLSKMSLSPRFALALLCTLFGGIPATTATAQRQPKIISEVLKTFPEEIQQANAELMK
jgi:hypothetical protein